MSGGDGDEKTPEAEEPLRNMRCSGGGGFFRRPDVHFILFAEGAAFRGRSPAYHYRDFPAKGMNARKERTYEDRSAEKSEAVRRFA